MFSSPTCLYEGFIDLPMHNGTFSPYFLHFLSIAITTYHTAYIILLIIICVSFLPLWHNA